MGEEIAISSAAHAARALPTGSPPGRAVGVLIALGLLAYVAFNLGYIHRTSFEVGGQRIHCLWDDGMISMRYARNLALGDGFGWNPGEPAVQGYTNLGITLVMTAIHWLPVPRTTTSLYFQLLNLAALVGIALLVRRIAAHLFGPPAGGIALSMTLLSAPTAIWALQGSDSGLVSLWLVACIARALGLFGPARLPWPTAWLSGALLALGPLLRLDAMIYVLPLLLYGALARSLRSALTSAAIVALGVGAILAFGQLYYGDPLPNTFYLRGGVPFAAVLERGLESLIRSAAYAPLLAVAAIACATLRRSREVWLCAACLGSAIFYNAIVGGDWADAYASRYMVPALPLLFVLCGGASADAVERLRRASVVPARWIDAAVVALFALLAAVSNPAPAWREWTDLSEPTLYRNRNQEHATLALSLRRQLNASDVVAVTWAGVTPYFRDGPALDVLGKSDRHIARLEVERFAPGHSKWDWDYVLDQRPAAFTSASRGLDDNPRFTSNYQLALDRRNNRYSIYVRKDVGKRLNPKVYDLRPLRPAGRPRRK